MAATTADLVGRFVALTAEKKKKEADFEDVKAQLATLEPELITRFINAGTQKIGALGYTVYLHHQLWCRAAEDPRETVKALKACGLGALVEEKFNTNQLSAHVREVAKATENGHLLNPDAIKALLPQQLAATVDITEKVSLRAKKG